MNLKEFKQVKSKGGDKKIMKTKIKQEKGITLIALVVTIVVLLILAGVSINAIFSDNGIINKAKDAQNKMDQATQNDLDAIDGLSNWIDSKTNGNAGGGDTPTVPVEPTADTAPYYPDTTFTKLEGTDLSNGLVIKDAEGNEYVWIEVPKSLYDNTDYNSSGDQKTNKSIDYAKIEYCLHKYTEDYRKKSDGTLTSFTDEYPSDKVLAGTGLDSDAYTALKQKMLKSVYENGGFWIGRYEAGIETNRTAKGDATIAPISKAGKVEAPVYPYTYVTCSQAQTLTSKLSTGKSYTSSLMFGVQWDLVLKHIEVKEVAKGTALATIQSALRRDSKDWGNYYNASFEINRGKYAKYLTLTTWYNYNTALANCVTYANGTSTKVSASSNSNSILLTTGASDTCKKMNIYDLAGNVYEWTLEYPANAYSPSALRGGSCNDTNVSGDPASNRLGVSTTNSNGSIGFRSSLFK